MNRVKKYLRDLSWMDNYRILRPLRKHIHAPRMDRRSFARGVAVGIFFGILTPVAQILFAVVAAIALRANVAVAAVSTLVTNPFTFPFVYYIAFRIGAFVTGHDTETSAPDVEVSQEAATHVLEVRGWYDTLINWIQSIGPPLATGVFVLALASALFGFLLVHLSWRWIETRSTRGREHL